MAKEETEDRAKGLIKKGAVLSLLIIAAIGVFMFARWVKSPSKNEVAGGRGSQNTLVVQPIKVYPKGQWFEFPITESWSEPIDSLVDGVRCRVKFEGTDPRLSIDIRLNDDGTMVETIGAQSDKRYKEIWRQQFRITPRQGKSMSTMRIMLEPMATSPSVQM